MDVLERVPLSVRTEHSSNGERIRIVVTVRTAPKATIRNRARRRIREALRSIGTVLPERRLTITVRDVNLPPSAQLRELLVMLMQKSGIVHR